MEFIGDLLADTGADLSSDLALLGAGLAVLLTASLWVRWATIPVLVAFKMGQLFERTRHGGKTPARRRVGVRAR